MGQGLWGLVVVGAINTVISVYYYLRPVVSMYMMSVGGEVVPPDSPVVPTGNLIAPIAADALSTPDSTLAAARPAVLPIGSLLAITLCVAAVGAMFLLQTAVMQWAREAAVGFVGR
jgi:NADH:ubiquinone oxidoreductase subunit 2 (subunit N)